MWTTLVILTVHTVFLVALAWWHLRAYRKSAQASRRRVERMLAAHTSDMLRREVEYLQKRNDILLRGLFPRGEVFVGNFIADDPELGALCELLEIVRQREAPAVPDQERVENPSPSQNPN